MTYQPKLTNGLPCSDSDFLQLAKQYQEFGPKDFGAGEPVTKPTAVYRVEMPDGNGPYNSTLPNTDEIYKTIAAPKAGFNCCYLANVNRESCGVSDHSFREANGHADYGCDSMASIYRWFPLETRKYLQQFGARIIQYRIPTGQPLAVCGNGEILFNKHSAQRVSSLPMTGLEGSN